MTATPTAPSPRVAVLGAGPVGLDAALAMLDAGLSPTVYEAGDRVGAAVRAWGHVRMFTPWPMAISHRMRCRLDATGVRAPDDPDRARRLPPDPDHGGSAARGTQERLAACHYAMAHPESGTLVPACVQHALLDPVENRQLRRLLPLTPVAHDVEAPARADTPGGSG